MDCQIVERPSCSCTQRKIFSQDAAALAVRLRTPTLEYSLPTQPIFWFIRPARMTDAASLVAYPAEETPQGSTDDACKADHFKAGLSMGRGKERFQWPFTYRCISLHA